MTNAEWEEKFGQRFMITLTDEERRYLGLSALSADWDALAHCSKTNAWCTRVTVFFDGDTIVKVIGETGFLFADGTVKRDGYEEYDTRLQTDGRKWLLPLTARGKPKPLTASNIKAVTPFGCRMALGYNRGKDSCLRLHNPRANKRFPIGEEAAVAAIRSEADFHAFMNHYIATCRDDYFDKLQAFQNAKKVTVRYRPGDIFRMELDRTHYCYGIITGTIKKLNAMPELPEKHSLREKMMVPILVRLYHQVTDDPNRKAEDLRSVPLGRVLTVADNDIIWGTHTIVDHKTLAPEDLEFNFVCTKIAPNRRYNDQLQLDPIQRKIPMEQYTLYIEWGFAQTSLRFDQLSDKLKDLLADYSSPHGGVFISIDPGLAVPDEKHQHYILRESLLSPENREMLNEIFACLGLAEDTTFDQFAERYGGLSLQTIAERMQ